MRRFFISGLLVAGLVVLVGVGFLAWIGSEGGLTPVSPASEGTRDIQAIYVFIGAFASAIFLAVTIPLVLFAIRFRRGERDRDVEGPQIRGHTRLELTWTAIPILILVAIAAFTFVKLPSIQAADSPELVVQVEGRQFYWRFVYPNGVVSFDTLRVPVDTLVRLEISSPEQDVIHSFWVPALGGKMDAIPGVDNELNFRAIRTGSFQGKCAELCGIQHGAMLATAEVLDQAEFDAWLAREAAGQGGLGRQIFDRVCSKCHFAAPEYAPNIAGNPILQDADALRDLLRNGRGRMPDVGATWTEAELDALIEHLGGADGG
ncbi:MAG: cytochrome c oxidase subunit II [Gaiellaceae bacterium]